jgi:acyl-CoA reductase-like NAD-dependent aldehyde dehydrogenase
MILKDKDISSVSFVGSTPVAKYIYENQQKMEKEFRP